MWLSRAVGGFSLIALSSLAASATADSGAAERLFEEGLEDMLAGRYATGCPALAESYRLDPLPGALFTLAECENKWGKLARALGRYRDYVARFDQMTPERQAQQGERVDVARAQITALEARVPRLRLRVAGALPVGAVVRLDGEIVSEARLERAIEVDPGVRIVELQVGAEPPSRQEIAMAEGEAREVTLATSSDPAGPRTHTSAATVAGWSLLGFGAAGIVVGTATGLVTLGHKGTIDDACVERRCTQAGLDAANAADVTGAVSTASFAVGAAALVAGGLLIWLGGDDDLQVGAAPGFGGAIWRHRW